MGDMPYRRLVTGMGEGYALTYPTYLSIRNFTLRIVGATLHPNYSSGYSSGPG